MYGAYGWEVTCCSSKQQALAALLPLLLVVGDERERKRKGIRFGHIIVPDLLCDLLLLVYADIFLLRMVYSNRQKYTN